LVAAAFESDEQYRSTSMGKRKYYLQDLIRSENLVNELEEQQHMTNYTVIYLFNKN